MALQSKIVPDEGFQTNATRMALGAELKTALAAGKMRLFKGSLTVSEATTAAELAAAEADYDGYAAGGIAVANFLDPYLDENGSVLVTSPVVQFNYVDDTAHTANVIGGAWYEDAAGVPRGIVTFNPQPGMASNSNSIPVVVAFRIGNPPDA